MVVKFEFKDSNVPKKESAKIEEKLVNELALLNKVLKKGYDDKRASINLPIDNNVLGESEQIASKVKDAEVLVVVGIGGSNLGTIAVYEALYGKLYNETQKKKVYFADTVDSNSISNMKMIIKNHIKENRKVVLNIISKSGGTTETIANFNTLFDVVKEQKNYQKYIVVTTGKNSRLYDHAMKEGYHVLTIPDNVGGRYSVFSNVGIFPLTFLGVDAKNLLKGAKAAREDIKSLGNPAIISAINIYYHAMEGKNIINTFLFSTQLESIGKWYRQLMGESIGKEFDLNGKKVNVGLTPTTAIGSTDLHSMAQLYLGGPDDKFHVFVELEKTSNIKLNNDILLPLKGKTLHEIMDAILKGVKGAFKQKKIPYYEIILEDLDEYHIGGLLQYKMIEMMLLGSLFNVNPFDQPNVEEYKIITKKYLD